MTTARRPLSPPARDHHDNPPLVGRHSEMAALTEVVDAACGGAGQFALIEGGAGLGKSRLLAELSGGSRQRGAVVLSARGTETDRSVPFSLALGLFLPLLAGADKQARGAYLDGAAGLIEPLLSGTYWAGEASAAGATFPLVHGLFWLTVNIAHTKPVVLMVDDAHWSDDASLQFVHHLVKSVHELPVAVVVATRPATGVCQTGPLADLHTAPGARRLRLGPLDPADAAELVRERVPEADAEFCQACARVTHGNPFHLLEMLWTLAEDGLVPDAGLSKRVQEFGDASIGRAALFRLARLGAPAIALARALAVLGDGTSLRRAAALADLDFDVAAAAADALSSEHLIQSSSPLAFTHPLIGELVHGEMPPLAGAQSHAKAARLLAAEHEAPERIAAHLLQAPAVGAPATVETLRLAAARARTRGAPEVAAQHLARALEEPPEPQMRRAVLLELGSAELAAGRPNALDHVEQALELSHDQPQRAEARRLLARALAAAGRRREAADCLEVALDFHDPGVDRHAVLADYLTNAMLEPGVRQRAIARTSAAVTPVPTGSSASERAVLAALAVRSAQDAQPVQQTIDLATRAWGNGALLADGGPDGVGWLMTVWAFALAGEHRDAVLVASAARNEARRLGSAEAAATASYFRATYLMAGGHLDDAQEELARVIDASATGWRRYLVAALAQQVILLVEKADLVGAAAALATAHEHGGGSGMEIPWRLHAEGTLAAAQHRPADALRLFAEAGSVLERQFAGADNTVLPWRVSAARAALAAGDPQTAREVITPDLRMAERTGACGRLGRALAVSALIDRDETSEATLRRACDLLTQSQELLERVRAEQGLGSLLRKQGQRTEARAVLTRALDTASRLGATALAQRIHAELTATGARPRTSRVSGPAALTPGERRVTELAAAGLTNNHIAQQLFVTPKTVEYHLRHAFQKLHISNRSQLAQALGEA